MDKLLISIIVPCFNEEAVIKNTYQRIKNVLTKERFSYEIVFINDGSSDNTVEILKNIAVENKNIKLLSFSRNFGYQPVVSAGIKECKGDIAIIIDAGLQDSPELFPEMIKLYKEKACNVVYAVRKQRKGETFFKKLTAKVYYKTINALSDTPLPLDAGDSRLKVIEEFKKLNEKNKYIRGIITWIGFKQEAIYSNRDSRAAGITKSFTKMLKFTTTGLFYFSKKPLKLAITTGFSSIVVGISMALFLIIGQVSNQLYIVQG